MKRKIMYGLMVLVGVYLVALLAPAFLGGSVLDPQKDNYRGEMTGIGGKALQNRAEQTVQWILEALAVPATAPLSICEVGPGRGVLFQRMTRVAWWDCYAVDLDKRVLTRMVGAKDVYCQRVPPLPAEMPSVHAIVAEFVIEHVDTYAEAQAFMQGCYDKLKPGGCIVLRFPDVRVVKWGFWGDSPDHGYVTTPRRVTSLLGKAGFRIVRQGSSLEAIEGWKGRVVYAGLRCFPWQVMHNLVYKPWQSSPWSRLALKVPHAYVVAVKP